MASQQTQQPSLADAATIVKLETKVSDLELLNAECLSVIKNLQKEVEDKSKKILKLELAGNRAKIVTHHEKPTFIEASCPKIEMTSLIASKAAPFPSSSSSSLLSKTSSTDLNLIMMYEKKNEQLDRDLQRLQQELERAKEILAQVDHYWREGQQTVSLL